MPSAPRIAPLFLRLAGHAVVGRDPGTGRDQATDIDDVLTFQAAPVRRACPLIAASGQRAAVSAGKEAAEMKESVDSEV